MITTKIISNDFEWLSTRELEEPLLGSCCYCLFFCFNSSIPNLSLKWRRGWDSNSRYIAVRLLSKQVPSTTRPPLPIYKFLNPSFLSGWRVNQWAALSSTTQSALHSLINRLSKKKFNPTFFPSGRLQPLGHPSNNLWAFETIAKFEALQLNEIALTQSTP